MDEVKDLAVSRSTRGRQSDFSVVVVAVSVGLLIVAASLRQHDSDIAGMLALGTAMNDDHKNQAAAWKLVMDRILPVAAFEKDIVQNGGKSAIQINITGVGGAEISQPTPQSNIIDGDSGEILQD